MVSQLREVVGTYVPDLTQMLGLAGVTGLDPLNLLGAVVSDAMHLIKKQFKINDFELNGTGIFFVVILYNRFRYITRFKKICIEYIIILNHNRKPLLSVYFPSIAKMLIGIA